MIGDRKYDMIGATRNNMDSVGVAYGYGTEEELQESKATVIVQTFEQLQQLLLGK